MQKKWRKIPNRLIAALRKFRIFPRLFFIFSIFLIFPTIFITLFNQYTYSKEMEENHLNYMAMMVQNASYKLEQELSQYEKDLFSFIQEESVLAAIKKNKELEASGKNNDLLTYERNSQTINNQLLYIRNRDAGFKTVFFVADEGPNRGTVYPGQFSQLSIRNFEDFYASKLYQETKAGSGYPVWLDSVKETSSLFFENASDSSGIIGCVTLSYQVFDSETKENLGMIIACIYPGRLTQLLQEFSGSKKGNSFLVGNAGLLEGINASFAAPAFPAIHQKLVETIFNTHEGYFRLEEKNRDIFVNYYGIADYPLHIVNLSYRDQILAKAEWLSRLNVAVLLFFLLIGLIGFYIAATSISRPVNKLVHSAKLVGQGDFSAVYKPKSRDEIGVLCLTFDQMVTEMQGLIDQVYLAEIKEKDLLLNEKTAQLDALQMQISPHFLYNTLDMIRWQALYDSDGEGKASVMIEQFCDLLRMMTKGSKNKETLAESVASAKAYVQVMNFRYKNKINLETDLRLDPEQYLLPCFTLQPIVENAIKHAFPDGEKENKKIKMEAETILGKELLIKISDNGAGMDEKQLAKIKEALSAAGMNKKHIGLRNVHQRCKLYYGEKYGISIESWLEKGTVLCLYLPIEYAREED